MEDNDASAVEQFKQKDSKENNFVVVQLHALDDFHAAQAQEKFSRMTAQAFQYLNNLN